VSDVKKGLKKLAVSPTVARWEKGEKSEGVRDALKAGSGDIRAGARKLGLEKPGLKAELAGVKCPAGTKKKGR
jgi:hypothetical protein